MIFHDEYMRALGNGNATITEEEPSGYFSAHMQEVTYPLLKCVRPIQACPILEVGDLLFKVTEEIRECYEYVVCQRKSDGMTISFRIERLSECFEVVDVTEKIIVC